jgi:hypothetical protein
VWRVRGGGSLGICGLCASTVRRSGCALEMCLEIGKKLCKKLISSQDINCVVASRDKEFGGSIFYSRKPIRCSS